MILEQNHKQQQHVSELEKKELTERIQQLQLKEEDVCKANKEFKKKELDQSRLLKQL